jgi:hypothetical protein
MDVAHSKHGEMRNAYKIFVENPKRKRALGKQRCRLVESVKTNGVAAWTGYDPLASSCEHGNELRVL